MTYEGVKKHYMLLRRILWEYLVVDEGQKIKNEESLLSIVFEKKKLKINVLVGLERFHGKKKTPNVRYATPKQHS